MQQQQLQQLQAPQYQYQYQSSDPNNKSYILPPSSYQPAPGDVPAFVKEEQKKLHQNFEEIQSQQENKEQEQNVITNKKEDVIQINFSDDNAANIGVTTLDKEQAEKYNSEIQQSQEKPENNTNELTEGSKYGGTKSSNDSKIQEDISYSNEGKIETLEDEQKRQEIKIQEKQLTKIGIQEPTKSENNLLRIVFAKDSLELSEKDKNSLQSIIVSKLKSDKNYRIIIKSYSSGNDLGLNSNRNALLRVISLREFLIKQGINFSQTETKILSSDHNKEDIDYIDIDKI